MIILDCENYKSTIKSLVKIYDISVSELEVFFRSFDIDKHFSVNSPGYMGDIELRNVFEKKLKLTPKKIDKVCWFHLTRTLSEEDFNDGILPLSLSLEKVWEMFFSVFKDTEHCKNIKTIKALGVDNDQYQIKAGVASHAGPYAMLIRAVAFSHQNIASHDYLSAPEIVEDICNGYEKRFGLSISSALRKALVPKIIKFSINKDINGGLESALYYAYSVCNNKKLSSISNKAFDGGNEVIPYNRILSIESIKA